MRRPSSIITLEQRPVFLLLSGALFKVDLNPNHYFVSELLSAELHIQLSDDMLFGLSVLKNETSAEQFAEIHTELAKKWTRYSIQVSKYSQILSWLR